MKNKILTALITATLNICGSFALAGCKTSPHAEITITINYNNDINTNTSFIIDKGTAISNLPREITSPSEYLVFDCWCTDSALTTKFNITDAVYQDTTLYAKWKIDQQYTYYKILSNSMQASGLTINDIVIVKLLTPADTILLNDIVLFNTNSMTLLHHISEIIDTHAPVSYKTKGSSNAVADSWTITKNDIIGKFVEKLENPENYLKYIGTI